MFEKAEKVLKESIATVENMKDAKKQLDNKKIIFAPWCSSVECEDNFKEATGAKSLNAPFEQPDIKNKKCFACEEKAKSWFYLGKSY